MRLYLSYYQLKKKETFSNSLDYQNGALLKLVDLDGHYGVADICPWPHLGDLSLEQEIEQRGLLFQSAYELAKVDLDFKRNKKSLLKKTALKINKLVVKGQESSFSQLKNQTIKLKVDADFSVIFELLENIDSSNRLRLDFNSKLNSVEFENFLTAFKKLSEQKKSIIQYVEDPTPFNFSLWKDWNKIIPLAADFIQTNEEDISSVCSFLIWKPSRQWPANKIIQNFLNKSSQNVVITSAMDHPVGIAHAMWIAQQFQVSDMTGLSTLDLYEENKFYNYFNLQDQQISFTDLALNDYGIGMSEAFERLEWKQI